MAETLDERAERRDRELERDLRRASGNPRRRIAAASDYLRSAMAVSPHEAQVAAAAEVVPMMVGIGKRLMTERGVSDD
jgi:hypothetical protein